MDEKDFTLTFREREMASLAYLGVERDVLAEKYCVSKRDVYDISRKLKDDVAENVFGKIITRSKTPFERGLEYIMWRLKNPENSRTIYGGILAEAFEIPLAEEALKRTGFELKQDKERGYESLLRRVASGINGSPSSFLLNSLEEYIIDPEHGEIERETFLQNFSTQLRERIESGDFEIDSSDVKRQVVDYMIRNYTREREGQVLKAYYGIGVDREIFREIGKRFALSTERIRQINGDGLRSLRLKEGGDYLTYLFGHNNKEVLDKFIDLHKV